MKKIPTLFKREFKNGKVVGITDQVLNAGMLHMRLSDRISMAILIT